MKDISPFASTLQRSDELINTWNHILDRFEYMDAKDGTSFDLSVIIPDLDLTIYDFDFQVNLLIGEIQKFKNLEKQELSTVPPMSRVRLNTSLSKINDSLKSLFETLKKDLNNINAETFQGSVTDPNRPQKTITINFAEKLLAVGRSLDDAFVRIIHIKVCLPKSRKKNVFPGIVQNLRELLNEIKRTRDEALKTNSEVTSAKKSVVDSNSSTQKYLKKIEEALQASIESSENAKQNSKSAKAANESIDETLQQSRNLKEKVVNYQSDFDEFQNSLNDYKEQISTGNAEQNRLLKTLKKIEDDIEDKVEQANSMLANATVAGLAASFGETRNKLNEELKQARGVFYISIAVLAVLALPMILYLLPDLPYGGPSIDRSNAGFGAVIGEVIARVAILLPGIWFVSFSSKRASSLFRLREHYEYKYNMAVSVEGFKQQAQEIASAIAGTTFYELLTRNPADVMEGTKDSDDGKPPNPLLEAVMRFMKLSDKKDE